MTKPKNPFKKGTLIWNVMEGDWEDLTAGEIAEVLGTTRNSIYAARREIQCVTGYTVPYKAIKPGRKRDGS